MIKLSHLLLCRATPYITFWPNAISVCREQARGPHSICVEMNGPRSSHVVLWLCCPHVTLKVGWAVGKI